MITRSDDLTLLLAVVDSGGFSAAAEQLGIQVARVSRAVSRLERQLGTTLLNRTTRQVELTEEGRRFSEEVRRGLALLDRAEEALHSARLGPSGRLRVDAASPLVLHQLVPLVAEFAAAYPAIRLELSSSDGIINLLEKQTDVAIRIGGMSDSTLHARLLGESPLHIVASPDYLRRRGSPASAAELDRHRLLGFIGSGGLNRWPLARDAVVPDIAASSGETLRQLALAGNGIACLSRFMIGEDLAAGRLVPLLQQEYLPLPEREQVHAVYYRHSALSARIGAFLDFIGPRLRL
jgi:DNA-binding transcriptional LysR family regulator